MVEILINLPYLRRLTCQYSSIWKNIRRIKEELPVQEMIKWISGLLPQTELVLSKP